VTNIERMLLYLAHEIHHDAVTSTTEDSFTTARTFTCRFCDAMGAENILSVDHELGCPCWQMLLHMQGEDQPSP
jgi:hypothetical protein